MAKQSLSKFIAARKRGEMQNAGAAWTPNTDAQLRTYMSEAVPAANIARLMGRTVAGVTARMDKLARDAELAK